MKRLLLSLLPALLLVLLSSCARGSESIGLWSEEGVVVYSSRDDGAMITIDKALLQEMTGEGELEELVSSLFPRVKLYRVEVSQWRQREAVVSSLVAFTETESLTEAYGKEKKSISSSEFFSSMKTISEGFDDIYGLDGYCTTSDNVLVINDSRTLKTYDVNAHQLSAYANVNDAD